MDVKNVNSFTDVIVNTFETAVNSAPFRTGDFCKEQGPVQNQDDLLCVIRFSGSLTGAVVMSFPEGTARKVYSALMFEEVSSLTSDVIEAFSEILNMVIGNVRAALSTQKLNFEQPRVEAEKNTIYANEENVDWLHIPMAFTDWGKFNLYIGMKES